MRSTLAAMPAGHVSRVCALYRRILLLHRGLPPDLKALGDQYVKDEFRRHKTVGSDEARRFLQEWEASECHLFFAPDPQRCPVCPCARPPVSAGFPRAPRRVKQRQPVPFELNSAKLFKQYFPKLHPVRVYFCHRFLAGADLVTSASPKQFILNSCQALEG